MKNEIKAIIDKSRRAIQSAKREYNAGEYDMVCAACQGKMIEKNADLDLRIGGELYIAHNVSFEECINCGERVVAPETSENIYPYTRSGS